MKGHQDSSLIMVLSREVWMNIEMDEDAKKKVSMNVPPDQPYSIPYEGWTCFLEGIRRITKTDRNPPKTS